MSKPRRSRNRRLQFETLDRRIVLDASFSVSLLTNGVAADVPPGPQIAIDAPVHWEYEVANTGDSPVYGLALMDDRGTPEDAADDFHPVPVLQAAEPAGIPSLGVLEATFSGLVVSKFAVHPTQPYLYAAVTSQNAVAVINTNTLQLEDTIFIGSNPQGMALSADGSRLYVANATSNAVGVLDTQTREALASIPVQGTPRDIEVGADGRLYVLSSGVRQIDPNTGESVGPVFGGGSFLEISPQKDRVYVADSGLSPASLYQYDVTVDPPALLWESPHGGLSGSNGQDLGISHDGAFISYAAGAGQGGYRIAKYDTSDMSIAGTFDTGAYPREITFSPDDQVAYTVHTSRLIDTWNTRTFAPLGTISTSGEANELTTDRSGRHLFAAFDDELRVYSTGRRTEANVGDTNADGLLDPGEQWLFDATGSALARQYANTATATGTSATGVQVTSRGSGHYFGVGAVIELESKIDGDDADLHPGPMIRSGAEIVWQYVLTNRGSYAFDNVVVTDDNGTSLDETDDLTPTYIVGDTNQNGSLDAGEIWRYELAASAATGQRQHIARVDASPVSDDGGSVPGVPSVTDTDATNYFGVVSAVAIEVATNGIDADSPSGPQIGIGDRVTWAYQVSNLGNVPLTDVVVVDDAGTVSTEDDFSPAFLDGDANDNGRLDPGETWIYTKSSVAAALQYANSARVAAKDSLGETVSDTDPSHYFGVGAIIRVESTVAGADAESQPGPLLAAGGEVVWNFTVSNLGSYSLRDVTISEDDGTASETGDDWSPEFAGGDINGNGLLDPNEVWRYVRTGAAVEGQYAGEALATAAAADASGNPAPGVPEVSDTESNFYFGVVSGVEIEVRTNGQDAKAAPGPAIEIGEVFARTFLVRNVGNVPLTIINVTDDEQLPASSAKPMPAFAGGDANLDGLLDPGEVWTYFTESLATALQHKNIGTVSAVDPLGRDVHSQDATHYFGTGVRIDLVSQVNGENADVAPGPSVAAGETIMLSYVVANLGSVPLGVVALRDDRGTPEDAMDDLTPRLIDGDAGSDSILSPGESWRYVSTIVSSPGAAKHLATVSAVPVDDAGERLPGYDAVSDGAASHYFGVVTAVSVRVSGNGIDTAQFPGPLATSGNELNWRYSITNVGNAPLSEVSIVDNNGTDPDEDDFSPADVAQPETAGAKPVGTLERTFDLSVTHFVMHPTRPYLYAAVTSQNSVAIIHTGTLALEQLIFIGSNPTGMAISPDGQRLYVANGSSNAIGVLDTTTRKLLPSIAVSEPPRDVEVGADGRLYVLGSNMLQQIDPVTGATVGPNIGVHVYSGELEINAAKDRLYYADYGLSPASLYQFDLTTDPPTQLWESDHGATSGNNGQDLAISHDGSFISYAAGYGQTGYRIAKYDTTDMSIEGTFDTGAYPREITFSPDDRIAYTVHTSGLIDLWDTSTFAPLGTISTSGEAHELIVDRSGSHLFAAVNGKLHVYATGRVSARLNAGDVNLNGLLDPGETWTYAATVVAVEGQQHRKVAVSGTDRLDWQLRQFADSFYIGAGLLGMTENVSAEVATKIVTNDKVYTISDGRFELVDGILRLKAGEYLTHALDNGKYVTLMSDEPTPVIQRAFVLVVASNQHAWYNSANPNDVNSDGFITALDVLLVINELNSAGSHRLQHRPADLKRFLDSNGDGFVSPLDVLLVVNYLNRGQLNGEYVAANAIRRTERRGDFRVTVAAEDGSDARHAENPTVFAAQPQAGAVGAARGPRLTSASRVAALDDRLVDAAFATGVADELSPWPM